MKRFGALVFGGVAVIAIMAILSAHALAAPACGPFTNCFNDNHCAGVGGFCRNRVCECPASVAPPVCPDRCDSLPYCPPGIASCGTHTVAVNEPTVHVTDCRGIQMGGVGGVLSYCSNDGKITGRCVGWPSPRVEIQWSDNSPPGAAAPNSNSVLRDVNGTGNSWFFGGGYPGVWGTRINGQAADPNGPGGSPNYSVHDLRDDAVSPGNTYVYKAKYRPETPSSNAYSVTINAANCGGGSATPTPALARPTPTPIPGPPAGTIRGVCRWIGGAPVVQMTWSQFPPPGQGAANSNGLQKGDSYPNDGNRYWEFLPNGAGEYAYDDSNVTLNTQYQYRVKYRSDLPSLNIYNIYVSAQNCGGPVPTPGPLVLTPTFQTVPPNVTGFLTVAGGTGTYSWSAPDGTISGSGSQIGVTYTNSSTSPVNKTVRVTSGSQTATSTVQVQGVATFLDAIDLVGRGSRFIEVNDDEPVTHYLDVGLKLGHGFSPIASASILVQLSNTLEGVSSAPRLQYQESMPWNICDAPGYCNDGPYTVYAIFTAPGGNQSAVVMDNIVYLSAAPTGPPLVTINGDDPMTSDSRVALALQHGLGSIPVDEISMQIANRADLVAGADPVLFSPVLLGWDLCAGLGSVCSNGTKTVYVKYCGRGTCTAVVTDSIQMNAVSLALPAAILLDDGAAATADRFVTVRLNSPFGTGAGVSMRVINENDLTERDREVIENEFAGGGEPPPRGGRITPPSQTDQIVRLPTQDRSELESGTVRAYTNLISPWDLCQGTTACPFGTYKVYVQFYRTPTAGSTPGTLAAVGDEVSWVYFDTIDYALVAPTPSPTISPLVTPVGTPGPTGSPGPGSGGSGLPGWLIDIINALAQAEPLVAGLALASAVAVIISALATLLPLIGPGLIAFGWQGLMSMFGILPRRKKVWGTVYDANTKRPIPYAKVQLMDRNRRVLETRIADKEGRYGFLTTPESLQAQSVQIAIAPSAAGYTFPSKVSPTIDTFIYNNLYFGDVITVSEKTLINFDVPMDPIRPSHASLLVKSPSIALGASVAFIADAGFWLGLIMVPLSFLLNPNPFTFGILCLFLGTASLRLFGISEHPFGTVTDIQTGKAMPFALITLNDPVSGKRVAFAVSDEQGRYFLVAGKGVYNVVVQTPALIQPPRQSTHSISAKQGWITRELKV